jgi:hypothetical protein
MTDDPMTGDPADPMTRPGGQPVTDDGTRADRQARQNGMTNDGQPMTTKPASPAN